MNWKKKQVMSNPAWEDHLAKKKSKSYQLGERMEENARMSPYLTPKGSTELNWYCRLTKLDREYYEDNEGYTDDRRATHEISNLYKKYNG